MTAIYKNDEKLLIRFKELLKHNPFASTLGIELLEVSVGYAYAKIPFRKELTNVYGDYHGGALYAIADSMCGVAAATHGYYVTTIEGSMHYLKAGRATEYITCLAKSVKTGRTLTVIAIEIRDDKNMLLDTASFTMYHLKKKEDDEISGFGQD